MYGYKTFVAKAVGEKCVLWIEKAQESKLSTAMAQEYVSVFDKSYKIETDLFGSAGNDDDEKIIVKDPRYYITTSDDKIYIVVFEFGSGSNFAGQFDSISLLTTEGIKQFYPQILKEGQKSNEQRMIFLNLKTTVSEKTKDYKHSTLLHEFQHLLGYVHDGLVLNNTQGYESWYTEMLSTLSEDVLYNACLNNEIVKIGDNNSVYPRLNDFKMYTEYGVTFWNQKLADQSYSTSYAFGAYLFRNFGADKLLRKMTSPENKNVHRYAIDYALKALYDDGTLSQLYTFEDVAKMFYLVCINIENITDEDISLNREIRFKAGGIDTSVRALSIDAVPWVEKQNVCFENCGKNAYWEADSRIYPYGFMLSDLRSVISKEQWDQEKNIVYATPVNFKIIQEFIE